MIDHGHHLWSSEAFRDRFPRFLLLHLSKSQAWSISLCESPPRTAVMMILWYWYYTLRTAQLLKINHTLQEPAKNIWWWWFIFIMMLCIIRFAFWLPITLTDPDPFEFCSSLSDAFCKIAGGLLQNCRRPFAKLSEALSKIVRSLLQTCRMPFAKLSEAFCKIVGCLLQNCRTPFAKLSDPFCNFCNGDSSTRQNNSKGNLWQLRLKIFLLLKRFFFYKSIAVCSFLDCLCIQQSPSSLSTPSPSSSPSSCHHHFIKSSCRALLFGLPDQPESPPPSLSRQSTALHLLHATVQKKIYRSNVPIDTVITRNCNKKYINWLILHLLSPQNF